jgi:hypothetical protein
MRATEKLITVFVLVCAVILAVCAAREQEYTINSTEDFTQAVEKINASQAAGTHRITLTRNVTADNIIFPATKRKKLSSSEEIQPAVPSRIRTMRICLLLKAAILWCWKTMSD